MLLKYLNKFIATLILLHSTFSVNAADVLFGGFIPQGTPTIDGIISNNEWDMLGQRTLYKFFGEDAKVTFYLMWDSQNLYMAADIQDHELWIDDFNPDTPWISTFDDDAIKLEIDPNFSRDENLQPDDRVFAMNADGTGSRFDQGSGTTTIGAQQFDPIHLSAIVTGQPNDFTFQTTTSEATKDQGFTAEVAISWRNIFASESASAPTDGYSMGINFTNIEDDTGGSLNPSYKKELKRVFDEITRFMGEEDHPENWAEFVISSNGDNTAPAAISNLTTTNTHPFSTQLSFTATGDNDTTGYAYTYDIRYATTPLTESNWPTATPYKNNFRPQKSGRTETLKILGLNSNTNYFIGIKAIDEIGNTSPLATTSITTANTTGSDKGYLSVCPGQYYLCWENGEAIPIIGDNQGMPWPSIRTFYNGQMWDDELNRFRNFFTEEGIEDGRAYLKFLSDHGVNTIRIMAEAMDIANPVYLYTDASKGAQQITFNDATLQFLQTFLDECAAVNINVIIVPFDTFYYRIKWDQVPFSTAMGGPMSSADDLFKPEFQDYLRAILTQLVATIGDRKNLLGWDIINEFDSSDPSFGWNNASFSEHQTTANSLAEYLRSIDPKHMIFLSSVQWDPKFNSHINPADISSAPGEYPALIFNNPRFDFNSTHTYYHDIRDPNHNQSGNLTTPFYTYEIADLDNTIAPAARIKQGVQYYHSNSLTPKPYFNTEFGPITFFTKQYDQFFSQQDDEQYFHNIMWAHLASGEVGTGLRWPGDMLSDHKLTTQMRKHQKAVSQFVKANLDFAHFKPTSISQQMTIDGTNTPIVKIGTTDGEQGIIFLMKDGRRDRFADVTGATLNIPNLRAGHTYTIEFWNSYDETLTTATQSVSIVADNTGWGHVSLPTISDTQVIKLYRTGAPAGPATGVMITDELWIRALIHTEEKGAIEAVWKPGGEGSTTRGDKVIWGHFYASPDDVSWGSINNPELFVKIWFDVSGRVDVNYFHVSAPNIEVFSDLPFDNVPDQQNMTTVDTRYVRQYYENGQSFSESQNEDGQPNSATPTANPSSTLTINDLRIGAIINTVEKGAVEALWQTGGQDTTTRGDQVFWGHFYANPSDVTWGLRDNPDLFVKIWFDVSGRVDVNFFHVSVPDIDVYSTFLNNNTYEQGGRTSLPNRYIRQEYFK